MIVCAGAAPDAARELGDLIAAKQGFVAVSERALLEAEAATNSERGQIIRAILQDKGQVSLVSLSPKINRLNVLSSMHSRGNL